MRFIAVQFLKLLDFIFQVQFSAFQVADHQIVDRIVLQEIGDFIFELFVPAFELGKMGYHVWAPIYAARKAGTRFLMSSLGIVAAVLRWSSVSNSLPQLQQHQK